MRMQCIHDVIADGAEFEDAVDEEQDQMAYISKTGFSVGTHRGLGTDRTSPTRSLGCTSRAESETYRYRKV